MKPQSHDKTTQGDQTSPYLRTVLKVLGGTAAAQAIPLLVMLLLARMVSVEALGIYTIWLSAIYIATVPATARMEVLLVALPQPSDRQRAFRIGCVSSLVVGLTIAAIAYWLRAPIQEQLPSWAPSASLLLGLGTLALAMQTLWLSLAISSGAFGVVNRIRIVSAGLAALLQVMFVWWQPDAMMLMLGFVLGTAMGSWAAWSGLSRHPQGGPPPPTPLVTDGSPWHPSTGYLDLMKQHGRIPLIALPAALINTISQQIPVMLTGVRFGEEAAGFLGTAWRSISAPISVIAKSAQDVFKKRAADEFNQTGQCRSAYLQTLRLLAVLSIFPSVALFFWGPEIFALAFGEKFRVSGEIAQIFAPLLYLRFFASPLGYTFLIVRKPNIDLLWQIGLFIMSLSAFLLPQEAMTAFKAFSAGYAMMYVVYLILQWKAARGTS